MINIYEIKNELKKLRIVPVVKVNNAKDMLPLGRALIDGGLPVAEITFRTPAAEEAICLAVNEFPDMLVGAGTVTTTEQADRAIAAGARFIVSPGFNPRIVAYVLGKGIPMFPGVNSPTQIEAALELGLTSLKFFPAEASGGLSMLKAMSAPYGEVEFMPTGGIHAGNIASYLGFSRVIACGGSWMVAEDLISQGDFDRIRILAAEAVAATRTC